MKRFASAFVAVFTLATSGFSGSLKEDACFEDCFQKFKMAADFPDQATEQCESKEELQGLASFLMRERCQLVLDGEAEGDLDRCVYEVVYQVGFEEDKGFALGKLVGAWVKAREVSVLQQEGFPVDVQEIKQATQTYQDMIQAAQDWVKGSKQLSAPDSLEKQAWKEDALEEKQPSEPTFQEFVKTMREAEEQWKKLFQRARNLVKYDQTPFYKVATYDKIVGHIARMLQVDSDQAENLVKALEAEGVLEREKFF